MPPMTHLQMQRHMEVLHPGVTWDDYGDMERDCTPAGYLYGVHHDCHLRMVAGSEYDHGHYWQAPRRNQNSRAARPSGDPWRTYQHFGITNWRRTGPRPSHIRRAR